MPGTMTGIHILVVDDDLDMREVLCDYFRGLGAIVFEAENGKVALELLSVQRIEFILSDVQMPIMDGIELLKKIRAINPDIPLVLFATGQSCLTEESAFELGAEGLLHKPFNFQTLAGKIQQILSVKKAS